MSSSDEKTPQIMTPKKKNPKGKPVCSGQKLIIINHYKSVLNNSGKMKFRELITHISENLGIGYHTVRKTISEYNTTKCVKSPNRKRQKPGIVDKIDEFDKNAIRRKVHSFWFNKELPTIPKLLSAINEDETLPNIKKTSLGIVLKSLNFKYTKRQRNSFLLERSDLVAWRRNYLLQIRQFREEGRPIYYLDETWINVGDCSTKVWVDQTVTSHRMAFLEGLSTGAPNPTGKGKRLIILHIGSTDGFLQRGLLCFESKKNTSDYHDEMNGQTFKEWFEEILPLLKDNAVVVMDNAPYHSVKSEKVPNMTPRKKADIVNWILLKDEEIDITNKAKSDLIEIVKRLKPKYNTYVIDDIAKEAGKSILRLPPYHCELNPIELVWSMVKQYVKANNTTFKLTDVKNLLYQALDRVTPGDWQNFISHVITEEKKLWRMEFICDEMIDELETNPNYILTTGDTSDSSDDADDEDNDLGCCSLE
ncbi:uncharacterized protein LOC132948737 [Metopolophium dirhodum]|uniref:uncharacterized protein LOC132948737 n=1 Tax=Metopolophium dirhodum TaxID=44670 RepID=UPI00298F6D94|nr:uncharacterized protein LOC132948737 [Metopolophium dirhodum]